MSVSAYVNLKFYALVILPLTQTVISLGFTFCVNSGHSTFPFLMRYNSTGPLNKQLKHLNNSGIYQHGFLQYSWHLAIKMTTNKFEMILNVIA